MRPPPLALAAGLLLLASPALPLMPVGEGGEGSADKVSGGAGTVAAGIENALKGGGAVGGAPPPAGEKGGQAPAAQTPPAGLQAGAEGTSLAAEVARGLAGGLGSSDPDADQAKARAIKLSQELLPPPLPEGEAGALAPIPVNPGDLGLSVDQEPATVLSQLGQIFIERGYVQEARTVAEAAVRTAPRYAPAYAARGAATLASDEPEKALLDLRRALALDPRDPVATKLLPLAETRLAVRSGGGEKAAAAAKRAGERMKSLMAGEELLEDPAPRRPAQASGPSADPAAAAGPAAAEPRFAADAAAPRQAGVSDAGRRLVREAQAARQMGEVPKALALVDRAVALNPRHCDALNLRAELNARLKRFDRTAQNATNSLAHCPDNLPALNLRSMAFSRLGQFQPALSDAQRSVALAPRSPFGYLNRAEAEEGLGELRAMAKDLRRAAALDPRYAPRYEAKAREYELPLEPVTLELDPGLFDEAPAPRGFAKAAKPDGGREPRRRSLLLWVLATLAGSFLIALGLLQSLKGGTSRWRRAAAAGAEEEGPRERQPPPASAVGEDGVRLAAPFILRKPIGRGGMGVVYDAWDTALERRVAIKKMREELSQSPHEREQFIKEARLVANLVHPSIVSIHSIFEEEGELYLVFEYVDGRTLDAELRDKGRLGPEEARRLLLPVCEALEFAHGRRVVHRDLKPSNVMLTAAGKPKVMDFGIARAAKDTLARMSFTSTIAGTPLYMPPEAEQGVVSPAWDVYSLGAMTYELLTGRPPFPGPASGAAKLGRAYARLSTVDGALGAADEAVHAALDPDPERRPPTPLKFWEALGGKLVG